MAARRRRRRTGVRPGRRQNTQWLNTGIVAAQAMTVVDRFIELVPDRMTGGFDPTDLLIRRIVGTINIAPQAGSSASALVGLAIFRTVHTDAGARTTDHDPLSVDVDAGEEDILWHKQLLPNFGGPLDATALDLAVNIDVDLKGRPTLRKLQKRHGLHLVHTVDVDARLELTFKLRILVAQP